MIEGCSLNINMYAKNSTTYCLFTLIGGIDFKRSRNVLIVFVKILLPLSPFTCPFWGKKFVPKYLSFYSKTIFLRSFLRMPFYYFQCLTNMHILTTHLNLMPLLCVSKETNYPTNIFLKCLIFLKRDNY